MCDFKSKNELSSMDDIQVAITRIISRQANNFRYDQINKQIKTELMKRGVDTSILESFGLNNMISDTLEQLTNMGRFYCFNNIYVPEENKTDKRKRVVVSA